MTKQEMKREFVRRLKIGKRYRAISSDQIEGGIITAGKISANTITTAQIQAPEKNNE